MNSGPATTELLRGLNRSTVMRVIRSHSPVSRAEIGRRAGISPASVSAIISDLVAEGLVTEHGRATGEVGRPGRLLRFSTDILYLGCDFASSEGVRAGLVDLSGDIVETRLLPWPAPLPSPQQATEVVAGYLADAAHRHALRKIAAAGIGVLGVLDPATGLVRSAPLLGWSDVELGAVMAPRLPVPVVMDNDVNMALTAEVDRGAAAEARFAVLVSFAEGIGGAVLLEGQIHRGRGSAGEIGHIVIDTGRSRGDYTQVGVAEQRIFELVAEEAKREGIDVGDHDVQTAHLARLVLSARGSLTFSAEVESELSAAIAAVLAAACALLDPDVIILSGWISLAGSQLLDSIKEHLRRYVVSIPEICFSALGENRVVIGAALAACQNSLAGVEVVGARI